MTTPLHNTVTLTNPSEILAAVPLLLGFRPEKSIVLIAVHDLHRAPRLGLTVRADLPDADQQQALADYLVEGPIGRQGAEAVLLIVVCAEHDPVDQGLDSPDSTAVEPTHRGLISALRDAFGEAGISVLHASWAPEIRAGGPWRCYDEEDCRGEIADPGTSPLAAALAAAGVVTFESRQDWERLVAPEPPAILARRAARLDAMHEDVDGRRGPADALHDLEIVLAAIRRTSTGAPLTEDDLLRVLVALSDGRVRDAVLSTALGEWASAAERLWTDLVRKAPEPELAEVAALLAYSAYLRGEGTLAAVALDRIEATRPDHRLGTLLRQALDVGIPPADLAMIARDAADDARTLIDEGDAW